MRLNAALQGSLSEYLQHEYQQGAEAVTIGIKTATNGLKMSMRGQVRSAGLGSRLWSGSDRNYISHSHRLYLRLQ